MGFLKLCDLPDLYVDAYVRDQEYQLLFLSVWGSESHVQQFRARLSLPATDEDSIRRLVTDDGRRRCLYIGDPRRLDSRVGRPAQSVFFNLTHAWIFDKSTMASDDNKRRRVLLKRDSEDEAVFEERLWRAVVALCPIPLLPDWSCLLNDFREQSWIQKQQGFAMSAYCLNFSDEKALAACITEQLRSGRLALPKRLH